MTSYLRLTVLIIVLLLSVTSAKLQRELRAEALVRVWSWSRIGVGSPEARPAAAPRSCKQTSGRAPASASHLVSVRVLRPVADLAVWWRGSPTCGELTYKFGRTLDRLEGHL